MGNTSSITNETDRLRADLSRSRKGSVFLAACLILSIAGNFKLAGNHTTTFVPPNAKQSFWVSHDKVSPSALEEMALYVVQLSENYTPKNIDYKHNSLLERVDPEFYAALKTQLSEKADYVKRNDISNLFHETGVSIDERQGLVHVNGLVTTSVGKDAKPPVPVTIAIRFGNKAGYISVKSIKDVKR